jgi:hypothetical protein
MHKIKRYIDDFHRLSREVKYFLAFVFFTAIILVFVYAVAQNILRSGANEPQIQIAEDASFLLAHNAPMGPIVPEASVELLRNLGPFIQVYDEKGSLLDGNALLNGVSPKISKEDLLYTKQHGENRITWQPEAGTRIATIIFHYDGQNPGYVVSGRSLRETENRIQDIAKLCFFMWFGLVFVVGICSFFLTRHSGRGSGIHGE